ncbi:MAG: hypothetical protein PHU25_21725 [Deltaproteobacteria bacterium]|nr:hypothetical protein [Deltaproteobacteria bacterium]
MANRSILKAACLGLIIAAANMASMCGGDLDALHDADSGPDGSDTDTDTDSDSDTDTGTHIKLTGVDLLVVVDNSGSMAEEQAILSTQIFTLLNSFVDPLPGWPWPAIDDLRVAFVSSDMGLQWGAPAQPPQDGMQRAGCGDFGDNGAFQQGAYAPGGSGTISIQNDTIPCAAGASQCPTGWTCENITSGVGVCRTPGGDGANQTCPGVSSTWTETSADAPNATLPFQAACLSALGTDGCGFEQQLASAAAGVEKNKATFIRDDALLAVIVVSDEEDCSMQDGPGIFNSSQFKGPQINIACGENPQFLFEPNTFYSRLRGIKGDHGNALFFGAIVGVPYDPDKPGADGVCQGPGDTIAGCLEAPEMQPVVIDEPTGSGGTIPQYKPACTRGPADSVVTKARPGRRYVELATANPPDGFGAMSYVYSICNADWNPAMTAMGDRIAKIVHESK